MEKRKPSRLITSLISELNHITDELYELGNLVDEKDKEAIVTGAVEAKTALGMLNDLKGKYQPTKEDLEKDDDELDVIFLDALEPERKHKKVEGKK